MNTMIDFEQMIKVFDAAITSDDPRVQNALSSLVMLVALTHNQEDAVVGPFTQMRNSQQRTDREMQMLRRDMDRLREEVLANELRRVNPKTTNSIRGNTYKDVWVDDLSTMPAKAWAELYNGKGFKK
jgi:hypothetical protein